MLKPAITCLLFNVFCLLAFSQQKAGRLEEIDVKHYQFSLEITDTSDLVRGEAKITILFLKNVSKVRLDLTGRTPEGKGMTVKSVMERGRLLRTEHAGDDLDIYFPANKGDTVTYTIVYEGVPDDGLIISKNKYGDRTIFSDNWPNRAHHWIPCVDHPADKAGVDFIITAPARYQVVSNGLKIEETNVGSRKRSHWRETVPLPTKIMVIGVAEFAINYVGETDCVDVSSWVYPQDREKGFYDYALAVDMLPWFVKKLGPYPYRKLANVQSKTSFGGMENASAIFYAETSVKGDRTIEALLAHEIAHQWFGNSATESDWQHIWLSEGFATYMTHWYLENKYGRDSLVHRLVEARNAVIAYSKLKTAPVVSPAVEGNYMLLLNVNAYQKGGWILYMLRHHIGSALFERGLRNYYATYKGRNAATDDFRRVMEETSGKDLKQFFQQWLYEPGQPDLHIGWTYNASKKTVDLTITQQQQSPFQFTLEYKLVSGKNEVLRSLPVKEKHTRVSIPVTGKVVEFIPDPNTKLLFTATVEKTTS